jgi:hypothetical protein
MSWLWQPAQKIVLVAATTTNASRRRQSRQSHLTHKPRWSQPPAHSRPMIMATLPVGMACQIRNATPHVIMGKWSSGQPFSHDHEAGGRGLGLDHGSGAPGAWRNKSETPPPGVIMAKWSSGQPLSHDHDAGGRGGGLDHGSGAPGAWRARSESASESPGSMIMKACTGRAQYRTKLHDHGSGSGGAARLP